MAYDHPAKTKTLELLKEYQAKMVRHGKHPRWKLPGGKGITVPNDKSVEAWDSTYARLRYLLGIPLDQKTHLDFQHEKKEEHTPKHQPKREFLADLPEREERPKTPKSESPLISQRKIFNVNPNTAAAEEYRHTYGVGPSVRGSSTSVRGAGKIHVHARPGGRSGSVIAFSEEIRVEASRILTTEGPEAVKKYLDSVKLGIKYVPQEKVEMAPANGQMDNSHLTRGPIEETIERTRQQQRHFQAEADRYTREAARCEQVIASLENALQVASAPISDIQLNGHNRLATTTTPAKGPRPIRQKGAWREILKDVLTRDTTNLSRLELNKELVRDQNCSMGAAYQAILAGLKGGYLKDAGGTISYVGDAADQ